MRVVSLHRIPWVKLFHRAGWVTFQKVLQEFVFFSFARIKYAFELQVPCVHIWVGVFQLKVKNIQWPEQLNFLSNDSQDLRQYTHT